MRNTSCTSGIPRSFRRSEGLSALGCQGPHGGWTHAQDARCLLGRVAEQVHEQESGPLPRRDLEEELSHIGAQLRVEEDVTALRDRDDFPDGHRRTTATHPEPVQGDPEEVGGEVLYPVDL